MKKISFVILTYNSDSYIEECIESIKKINKIAKEIIIVDNGSVDNTKKIIKKCATDEVKLIELDKNYGTTISRNIGLHSIKETDYVCILDSDTIINEDAILILTKYVEDNDDVAIVGPTMTNKQGEKQTPYRKFPTWKIKLYKICPIKSIRSKGEKIEKYDVKELPDSFECDYLISACWVMKYDTYKVLGDLDEKIFYAPEDVEYCMRARQKGFKIVHLKNAKIIHLYQRISRKKLFSKANYTHILGLRYVLKKYKKFLKQYRKEGNNNGN